MAHSKVRTFALGLGFIVAGSVSPDLDHITNGTRAWGHLAVIPYAILFSLAITYICGLCRTWILRSRK